MGYGIEGLGNMTLILKHYSNLSWIINFTNSAENEVKYTRINMSDIPFDELEYGDYDYVLFHNPNNLDVEVHNFLLDSIVLDDSEYRLRKLLEEIPTVKYGMLRWESPKSYTVKPETGFNINKKNLSFNYERD